MAARKRLAAVAVMAIVMLTGCTYSAEEPGLFPTATSVARTPDPRPTNLPPQPTDPELPVAGEAVWTTGDGLDVTVRFAVHAVRRIPGATVLDWSVTPISSPVARFGDALPAHLDLGLSQSSGGDADVMSARSAEPHRVRAAQQPFAPELQPLPVLADVARPATASGSARPG